MDLKKLENAEDFTHGDIVHVVSYEENCGIEKGSFNALVVESKADRLILIPENFESHLLLSVEKGTGWELEVDWLLENDVDVYLVSRFDQLIQDRWNQISK